MKFELNNNYSIIFVLFLFLALFLKLFFFYEQERGIFSGQDINIQFFKNDNLQLKLVEQDRQIHFLFENENGNQVSLNINPEIKWQVLINGEEKSYQILNKGISFQVPPTIWGKTDVVIKRDFPFKISVDILFFLSIVLVLVFSINKKNSQTIIASYLLWMFSGLFILLYLICNLDVIFQKDNIAEIARVYAKSQYVMGQGSPEVIGDEPLYIMAGYEYVQGSDPSSINFEHPPLGKYIYGLSVKLFGNARIASIVMYFLVLALFVVISRIIFRDQLLIAITTAFFASEELILNLSTTTFLDLPLLLFLLLAYYFYLLGKTKNDKYFWGVGLSLGLAMASKIYFPSLIFAVALLIDLLISNKKHVIRLISSLTLTAIPLLVSYSVFLKNHGFWEFIQFQKWVFSWYMGKPEGNHLGLIFLAMLFGKITAWWDLEKGKILLIPHWTPIWSLLTLSFFVIILLKIKIRKISFNYIWSFLYLVFLSLGASGSNYLIILLPFIFWEFVDSFATCKLSPN